MPRLQARFLALFVPVFLAFVTLTTSFFVRMDERKARDELAARVGSQAAKVAAAVARHHEAGDTRSVQDLLDTLLTDKAVECVVLADAEGRSIAATPEGLGCTGRTGLQAVPIPLSLETGDANLVVSFTDAEVREASRSRRDFTILAIIGSLLIALLASAVGFRLIIGRPLGRLLGAIRAAAAGARPLPVKIHSRDELGDVIEAYNEMRERLEAEADQRRAHIAALDAEVAARERTQAELIRARDGARAAAAQLEYLATHDGLTGLLKRECFEQLVTKRLNEAPPGRVAALAFVDIDKFKHINDTYGHSAGDAVIRAVAERLRARAGDGDLVCRIGGDEFVLFLEHAPDRAAVESRLARLAADTNARDVEVRVEDDGSVELVPITISIGAVTTPDFGVSLAQLLPRADLALYRAKHLGRARLVLFEPALEEERSARMLVETELAGAIERGELEMHHQPIVDLTSGGIVGHEALMRWRHPERGMIAPADFLGVAHRAGLSLVLCEWSIATACRDAAGWREPHRVAVNVSPAQLEGLDLPRIVADILARTRLEPDRLEIEITEQVLLDRGDATIGKLEALKRLGVRVVLDDFGAGYASLSLLPVIAWDRVKIDRAFVRAAGLRDQSRLMLRLIVDLCRSMRFPVTVEGIETPDQLDLLPDLEGLHGQGFLFGRPRRVAVRRPDHEPRPRPRRSAA